jgi:hypothetical protein
VSAFEICQQCRRSGSWGTGILTSKAIIDNRLRPVASVRVNSAPRGKGTSLIGGYDVGSDNVRREELQEAINVGIWAMRRGGSTSARQTNTNRIGGRLW